MEPAYLDHHATTPVDPRVLEAMLPWFTRSGNPSSPHLAGLRAKKAVASARESVAACLGAEEREIVFTSGATESNNLALRGLAERLRHERGQILSAATEHASVLDPLREYARQGWRVEFAPLAPIDAPRAGELCWDDFCTLASRDMRLVSLALAHNEIGVLQPVARVGEFCQARGIILHCDATQAVGKIPVDVGALHVDLMSFSAHKFHGPPGIGALYIRRSKERLRIRPLFFGGGQEGGLRSGTLNVPGIIGLATALEIACAEQAHEQRRQRQLRDRLWQGLRARIEHVLLNGPALDSDLRLSGNLNVSFPGINGAALLASLKRIAVSSGSACASSLAEPSYSLRALGRTPEHALASLRFGLGRFTTDDDISLAVQEVAGAVVGLRASVSAR